jgi:ABC-type antimicrobial peptide transport system permease subunit
MLPVITLVGTEFAFLIGGLVVTETVFTLNGVGRFVVDAFERRLSRRNSATFAVDVLTCPHCGAPRRLIALITEPRVVRSILEPLGLPPEPPPRAPARAAPQSTLDFPETA